VSTPREIEALQAEVDYYRDSSALLRARLYRRGAGTTPRLQELQQRRDRAEARLRAARAEPRTTARS
jgi:outer membrane protein TolC